MNIPAPFRRRLHWLNLPGALLLTLLQRSPALNAIATADELAVASPIGAVLKAAVAALATLGAMNSLAGATPLVPSSGTATGITVATGAPVAVFYTVNGTLTPPMSWTVSGGFPPGLDFSGLTSSGSINTGVLQLEGTPTTPGTYTVSLQTFEFVNETGIGSPVYNYTITVTGAGTTSPPAFTTQPAGLTVSAGAAVTFTVAVSGSPTPTLQWRKDGTALPGATGTTFSIASAAASDAGSYTAVATNTAGSVTSSAAVLTVNAATRAPAFTTQPTSQTVTAGTAVNFTVTVTGSPTPTVQWQKDGINLAGATGTTLTIASAAAGNAGTYMAVATNAAGTATSSTATLTISAATSAPVFTTQPANQTVTVGSAASFTVAVTGSPTPTLQWQKDGANLAGATGSTFTIASVATADAGNYAVMATNVAGTATSSAAMLTVGLPTPAPASFVAQPAPQTVAVGQRATFTVAATGVPAPSYEWQRQPAGSASWESLSEGGSYHGVTSASLSIDAATAAMTGDQFRCIITNPLGTATSSAVGLSVSGAGAALLQYPDGIAADSAGNLYVADAASNTIQKITVTGVVSLLAGNAGQAGSQDGTGGSASFNQPGGVTLDAAGNVYVADTGNSTIRKITPAGVVSTLAGSPASRGSRDGIGTAAQFNQPVGLAVDSAGVLYVADSFNGTIRRLATDGTVTTVAGTAGSRGDADGTGAAAQFNNPTGVALDSTGNLYVVDSFNDTIRKIAPGGVVTTLAGSPGLAGSTDLSGGNALFNQPGGAAVDGAGNLFVADTGNATIRRITPAGGVTTLAGMSGIAGMSDSAGGVALFNQPRALLVDGAGNLLVADTGNAAIRKIAPGGAVTTLVLQRAVTSTPPPTTGGTPSPSPVPMGSASSGGGGGAVEPWLVAALALLAAARLRRRWRRVEVRTVRTR